MDVYIWAGNSLSNILVTLSISKLVDVFKLSPFAEILIVEAGATILIMIFTEIIPAVLITK